MDIVLMISVSFAFLAGGATLFFARRLHTTQRQLERARRRMERLDEIADDVANLELAAEARESEVQQRPSHDEPAERDVAESIAGDPPVDVSTSLRDSGAFEAVGLDISTDDYFDEDDFAPRMGREVSTEPRRQEPSRQSHRTPVGSPRTMTPAPTRSFVEVGSIQVRSDHVGSPSEE